MKKLFFTFDDKCLDGYSNKAKFTILFMRDVLLATFISCFITLLLRYLPSNIFNFNKEELDECAENVNTSLEVNEYYKDFITSRDIFTEQLSLEEGGKDKNLTLSLFRAIDNTKKSLKNIEDLKKQLENGTYKNPEFLAIFKFHKGTFESGLRLIFNEKMKRFCINFNDQAKMIRNLAYLETLSKEVVQKQKTIPAIKELKDGEDDFASLLTTEVAEGSNLILMNNTVDLTNQKDCTLKLECVASSLNEDYISTVNLNGKLNFSFQDDSHSMKIDTLAIHYKLEK